MTAVSTKLEAVGAGADFTESLHDLLRLTNHNRKELASLLEIHESTLSRWLNGRCIPRAHERRRVLSLRQTAIENLLEEFTRACSSAPRQVRDALRALLAGGAREVRARTLHALSPAVREQLFELLFPVWESL